MSIQVKIIIFYLLVFKLIYFFSRKHYLYNKIFQFFSKIKIFLYASLYRFFNSKNFHEVKTNYSKICGTTGLVIFLIKDALEYCGIIQNDKKNIPSILLKNLEYLETIEKKVDKYIDMLKS